jgi:MSHA biogenesis protein MshM
MYEQFFGLNELPFGLTPNTHFFLKSETHQQALDMLLWALKHKEGFIKVTGEVGTGKTLLCRKLLNTLEDPFVTAYLPNPYFSAETLYCLVAEELSAFSDQAVLDKNNRKEESIYLASQAKEQHVLALKQIQHTLVKLAKAGKQVVLVIDEAQAMPEETIEALRLLSNLETESEKLLQIVLFGQPELDIVLAKKNLRQLKQRITFQHYLKPLQRKDIEQYISHRMILAGYTGGRLFDQKAISLLCRASKGIPRLVNILCHKSLMSAFGQGEKVIQYRHMLSAISDTESVSLSWRQRCASVLFSLGLCPFIYMASTSNIWGNWV